MSAVRDFSNRSAGEKYGADVSVKEIGSDFAGDDVLVEFHGISETRAHFCRNLETHVK